ncbi:MAG: hypothetical protein J5614_08950 [Paludibacteraceae bacterium]|nr:hypothetical protein [Paludibacteraceae bacterium]
MTDYTNIKRNLQKLGFRVCDRYGDRDVLMTGCGYSIRIAATSDEDCVYAALTSEGQPVSWHVASRRCSQPGKWVGGNYHITVTPDDELNGSEYNLFQIFRSVAHAGHCILDLAEAW